MRLDSSPGKGEGSDLILVCKPLPSIFFQRAVESESGGGVGGGVEWPPVAPVQMMQFDRNHMKGASGAA